MSTIGLDCLYYAKITEGADGAETYATPQILAKAIKADLSVELAEAILYADDAAAEVVKAFKSGKLSLGVDDIGTAAAQDLTGAGIDDNGVLVSGISDNIGLIVSSAGQILNSLIGGIVTVLPELVGCAVTLLLALVNGIIENLPMLVEAALQVVITLANGIANALPTLIPQVVQTVLTIVNTLINNIPMLIEAALAIVIALAQGSGIEAQVSFNCKPFMYSFAGWETITLTEPGTVTNPEAFAALPYIKITGGGDITLFIGSRAYAIRSVESYIELDSKLMAAYKGSVLCNDKINFTEFPVLPPGESNISWTGEVTQVEIVPRWRAV